MKYGRMAKDLKLTAIHVTHDQAEAMSISDRIAVMKKGKIVQVGSSQELYMHPNSLFVAHFIGESNFLEGYITKANSESEIELREGLKIKAINQLNIKQGERVVLAIRPETCEMKKGHIVLKIVYLGKLRKRLLKELLFAMRLGLITATAS